MVKTKNGDTGKNLKWMTTLKNVAIVLGWGLLVVITVNHVVIGVFDLPFTPDTWAYWELSKTILGGDFYQISGWRNFQSLHPYSTSFPPLWPLLIALAAAILKLGPLAMPVIAGLFVIATLLVIEFTFRRFHFYQGVGAIAGCGLFLHKPFVEQIETAGSIPLAVFILSILLWVWVTKHGFVRSALLGACAGLLCLTRFDALTFAFILGLFLLLEPYWLRLVYSDHAMRPEKVLPVFNGKLYSTVAVYYVTLLVTLSPYILYSLVKFSKVWASDNSLVALSAVNVFVTDYYLHWPASLFNDPLAWLNKVTQNIFRIFIERKWIITILPVLVALFILWKKPVSISIEKEKETASIFYFRLHITIICIVAIAYSSTFIGYVVTGYGDKRYFSPNIMLDAVGFALAVCFTLASCKLLRFQLFMMFVAVLGVIGVNVKSLVPDLSKIGNSSVKTEADLVVKYDKLVHCYHTLSKGQKLLILGNNNEAARIAALTGIETLMMPRNYPVLDEYTRNNFINTYNVGAIYIFPENHKEEYNLQQCEGLPTFYYLK